MEELRKLEEAQSIMTLMQSHAIIGPDSSSAPKAHSHRFLANLALLLIQPCGDLDMNDKCSLIREHIPKITVSFLEEASLLSTPQAPVVHQSSFGNSYMPRSGDGEVSGLLGRDFQDTAAIGFDAMRRANSTLEDFCRSYFMFHGMDVNRPQSVFRHLPVLSFTESYIYQMDGLNEQIVNMPTTKAAFLEGYNEEEKDPWVTKFIDAFKTDPFRPLKHQLERLDLLSERIVEELRYGEEYWSLERKLCAALTDHSVVSVEDVMKTIHLKSFDYRVLNLLVYQLRGEKVNDLHMEFLSISEFLVEVSDDLFDYEDDILENNFNTLRMFVRIYGPSTAPAVLAKYITEAEEKYCTLLKSLDPELSSKYQTRCEEATKEGGGKLSGHPLGSWSIPPVIVNEALFRRNCASPAIK